MSDRHFAPSQVDDSSTIGSASPLEKLISKSRQKGKTLQKLKEKKGKMQFYGKGKISAIAVILLIASVTIMANFANVIVKAQFEETPHGGNPLGAGSGISGPLPAGVTPDFTVKTVAYISIRPATVGIGQTVLVNMFPVPAPNADRNFPNEKVTITKPDGTQQVFTLNSYVADGTCWFEYVPDQLGTWKFKLDFPGVYFPAGRYASGIIINATSGGTNYPQSSLLSTFNKQRNDNYRAAKLGGILACFALAHRLLDKTRTLRVQGMGTNLRELPMARPRRGPLVGPTLS